MDVFTMVVVIVIVGCLTGVLTSYFENNKKSDADIPKDILAEMDQLRDRIEVLEKIVTDERYQLTRDLNDLERRA